MLTYDQFVLWLEVRKFFGLLDDWLRLLPDGFPLGGGCGQGHYVDVPELPDPRRGERRYVYRQRLLFWGKGSGLSCSSSAHEADVLAASPTTHDYAVFITFCACHQSASTPPYPPTAWPISNPFDTCPQAALTLIPTLSYQLHLSPQPGPHIFTLKSARRPFHRPTRMLGPN